MVFAFTRMQAARITVRMLVNEGYFGRSWSVRGSLFRAAFFWRYFISWKAFDRIRKKTIVVKMMNIPVSQFAKKLEKHVAEIKQLGEYSPKLREHVSAIQALCELMMDAEEEDQASVKKWVPSHPVQKPIGMVTVPSAKPQKKSMMDYDMDYDDGDLDDNDGNGDSIFDF